MDNRAEAGDPGFVSAIRASGDSGAWIQRFKMSKVVDLQGNSVCLGSSFLEKTLSGWVMPGRSLGVKSADLPRLPPKFARLRPSRLVFISRQFWIL